MRWVRKLAEDHTICLVSGRPDTYQRETMNWLIKWAVPYDYLFMRSGGDHRPDTEVKAKILKHIPRDLLQFVIDDRPQVIRMWRENGVKVYQFEEHVMSSRSTHAASHIHDLFSDADFQIQRDLGMVKVTKHPMLPLFIYNYTQRAQFTPEHWNHVTDLCRGLVVDSLGYIVARGFKKFWNINDARHPETMMENLPARRPP